MCFFINKEKNCKMFIMTSFEISHVSYICDNPNDNKKKSQVVHSYLVREKSGEITIKENAFWSDEKIFKNIKPETVYEVSFKMFESSDLRSKYPSSFRLKKIKECKNNTIKQNFFDIFTKQKRKEEELCEKIEEEFKKEIERKQQRILPYKNTSFEIIMDSYSEEYDYTVYDEYSEEEIINKIKKSQDIIINTALDAAVKELFEDAKDWTENPNLTKQEFIDDLLIEKFLIIVRGNLENLEVIFSSNWIFTDHNIVCYVKNGKCDDVELEG